MGLKEKIYALDKFRSCMSDSAVAVSSVLMSQQSVLNSVSLNRNACKTKLYIDRLTKVL